MRRWFQIVLLASSVCHAQQPSTDTAVAPAPAIVRSIFHIRYVSGSDVYIDGGRDAGLTEDIQLVLKQDPAKPADDPTNKALEPGVVARFVVISVASTSAVCEIKAAAREVIPGDQVSLPDAEVDKIVAKNTLGNTRRYPMVISFSEGDPLDEDVREELPRPPLPEVNQVRGRIGFDMSMIQQVGQASSTSNAYGLVFRADITRILGTHWNLNGYWRGQLRMHSAASQATLQDTMNRTYLMALTYVNPSSQWTAGIGRLYVPWASSLETIDGAYGGRQFGEHTVLAAFAGSTPDPTAWDYNPQRRIGGALMNMHGGNFEGFHYASTAGFGVELLKWAINRPFGFTENSISYKRIVSIYHAMQVDKPTPNPSMPAIQTGLGRSLLSVRVQVHPRVALDLSDTYFRDVPTYDPTLVGTGLLDKYLYQGVNGGARIEFPRHIVGYFSLGQSSNSSDPKASLNKLFGATVANIGNSGIQADLRYAEFDSNFAAGTYTTLTVSRELLDHLRVNLQSGRYAYTSSLSANSRSMFFNAFFDTDLGSRLFLESMFTVQRGGALDYNQWTNTIGFRFNNRSASRKEAHANRP